MPRLRATKMAATVVIIIMAGPPFNLGLGQGRNYAPRCRASSSAFLSTGAALLTSLVPTEHRTTRRDRSEWISAGSAIPGSTDQYSGTAQREGTIVEVEIAEERIVALTDRFSMDHAEGRAWSRRADAFGTVAKLGGFLSRSGADDYECVYRERRLQPFWHLKARAVTAYERTRVYTVAVSPSVRTIQLGAETITVENGQFRLTGLESCRDEVGRDYHYDGLTRTDTPSLAGYLQYPGTVTDAAALAAAAEAGTVVVPPQVKASLLVRDVVAATIGKVDADHVLEEKVTVELVDLIYRPVYAFRYRHAGKEAVLEFDGLTGETRADGSTFEQYLGKVLEPRFLLDVGVEAVNIFVPGTQLVRLVVEHGTKKITDSRTQDH